MAMTFGGVAKSLAIGAAACGVAVIAPIGMPVVVAMTLAVAGTSLFVENVSDEMRKELDKKKKADGDDKA